MCTLKYEYAFVSTLATELLESREPCHFLPLSTSTVWGRVDTLYMVLEINWIWLCFNGNMINDGDICPGCFISLNGKRKFRGIFQLTNKMTSMKTDPNYLFHSLSQERVPKYHKNKLAQTMPMFEQVRKIVRIGFFLTTPFLKHDEKYSTNMGS